MRMSSNMNHCIWVSDVLYAGTCNYTLNFVLLPAVLEQNLYDFLFLINLF